MGLHTREEREGVARARTARSVEVGTLKKAATLLNIEDTVEKARNKNEGDEGYFVVVADAGTGPPSAREQGKKCQQASGETSRKTRACQQEEREFPMAEQEHAIGKLFSAPNSSHVYINWYTLPEFGAKWNEGAKWNVEFKIAMISCHGNTRRSDNFAMQNMDTQEKKHFSHKSARNSWTFLSRCSIFPHPVPTPYSSCSFFFFFFLKRTFHLSPLPAELHKTRANQVNSYVALTLAARF